MSIALANHHAEGSPTGVGFTTAAYDSSAGSCNFLCVLVVSYIGAVDPTLTDSNSNTWSKLTDYQVTSNGKVVIYYATNPTLSASHTFTVSGTGNFPAIFVAGFSGMLTASVFQAGTDSGANSVGTTIQPGSITPGTSPALVVTGVSHNTTGATLTIDLSFSIIDQINFSSGKAFNGGFAYLVQNSAAAVNPTWTSTASESHAANIAAFKGTAGGATPPLFLQSQPLNGLGVGGPFFKNPLG